MDQTLCITIKTATFDFSKTNVHVHLKTDKLDYLQGPMTDLKNIFVLELDKLLESLTGRIGMEKKEDRLGDFE